MSGRGILFIIVLLAAFFAPYFLTQQTDGLPRPLARFWDSMWADSIDGPPGYPAPHSSASPIPGSENYSSFPTTQRIPRTNRMQAYPARPFSPLGTPANSPMRPPFVQQPYQTFPQGPATYPQPTFQPQTGPQQVYRPQATAGQPMSSAWTPVGPVNPSGQWAPVSQSPVTPNVAGPPLSTVPPGYVPPSASVNVLPNSQNSGATNGDGWVTVRTYPPGAAVPSDLNSPPAPQVAPAAAAPGQFMPVPQSVPQGSGFQPVSPSMLPGTPGTRNNPNWHPQPAAPIPGGPSRGFGELLRFNNNPQWVASSWPRVSTQIIDSGLSGMRVALVSGTELHDLAGSLSYYFDPQQKLRRIGFTGSTGDPTELVNYLTQEYGLRPESELGGGVFVQQHEGVIRSALRLRQSPIVRESEPLRRYQVQMELNDPDSNQILTRDFLALLEEDQRWMSNPGGNPVADRPRPPVASAPQAPPANAAGQTAMPQAPAATASPQPPQIQPQTIPPMPNEQRMPFVPRSSQDPVPGLPKAKG